MSEIGTARKAERAIFNFITEKRHEDERREQEDERSALGSRHLLREYRRDRR